MLKKRLGPEDGFSLPELLVYMLIAGLVMAILIPTVSNAQKNSRSREVELVTKSVGGAFRDISLQHPRSSAQALENASNGEAIIAYLDLNGNGKFDKDTEPNRRIARHKTIKVGISPAASAYKVYGYSPKSSVYSSTSQTAMWDRGTGKMGSDPVAAAGITFK